MDPKFGWLQPEQEGKAAELWMRVWEAQVGGLGGMTNDHDTNNIPKGATPTNNATPHANGNNNAKNNRYNAYSNGVQQYGANNKTGKVDNKARVYGLWLQNNRVNNSHQRGCPWMIPGKTYSKGPIG